MKIEDFKIKTRLGTGFGILIVLMLTLGGLSIRGLIRLSNDTHQLYYHPLKVSNAALEIKSHIYAIHRTMKDIATADSKDEIRKLSEQIDRYELDAKKNFQTIFTRFLGNMNQAKSTHSLFLQWRSIREEVIDLKLNNHDRKAMAITKGKGADHVALLLTEMDKMVTFAIEKANTFHNSSLETRRRIITSTTLLLIGTILLSFYIASYIIRTITRPLTTITTRIDAFSRGDLNEEINLRRRDEIGQLADSLRQLRQGIGEKIAFANTVARGDYSRKLTAMSDNDELTQSLNEMSQALQESADRTERSNWLKNGANLILEQMRGDIPIQQLAKNVIRSIVQYADAQIGTFYIFDSNAGHLKLAGSYAFEKRKASGNVIEIGQGLIGQAAQEKEIISVTDIPEDYIRIRSSFGDAVPHNIIVFPLMMKDSLKGVIEIGRFNEFDDTVLSLIQEVSENIAIGIDAALSRTITKELLEMTQQQAEELQTQQEELKAANEELEEQTEELKASGEKLKAQQEELQATNEELEEKTKSLEEQRGEIVDQNAYLETVKSDLEVKARELEVASKYKSEFLANMSHELRTPLNSLLILAKDLSENIPENLNTKQIDSAGIIYNSGKDLLHLINEILDLSKIESGKMTVETGPVRLKSISENLMTNFLHIAEQKNLKFKIHIAKDAPETIHTDQQKLEQILKNLISNALKFTEDGQVKVTFFQPDSNTVFKHSDLTANSALGIRVKDTGIGIPENKLLDIFEAFQQADGSTSRKFGGTGLGLSISRELSKLLGGEIQLVSEPGKGSEFTVFCHTKLNIDKTQPGPPKTLPGKPEESAPNPQILLEPAPHLEDDREAVNTHDRAILIIEDDLRFARTLADYCHQKNFKFIHSGDGETGLKLAEIHKPDAIILDIKLPGMDGWAVLETLKKDASLRHIPVHMMSAMEETLDAYEKGAIGYLTKPVEKDHLNQAFGRLQSFYDKKIKDLLVVEDDKNLLSAIVTLLENDDVVVTAVDSGKKALNSLKKKSFDCMILDLSLPDISGFDVLTSMNESMGHHAPPVIIYTGRDISQEDEFKLRKYANSIIIKGVKSQERLLDETALFLHQVIHNMPEHKQKMISRLHDKDMLFDGKKVLLVDDDMRNTFAVSHVLEEKNMTVISAANGQKALEKLKTTSDIDIILMDIMMPVMDGYEAMKHIRNMVNFKNIPIIALTAKAMKEDREKCLKAGANDYLSKPVEIDKLLSLMRVWLYR